MIWLTVALADPCGMVFNPQPVLLFGDATLTDEGGPSLKRDGAQRTWISFDDGVETMVLRPGFVGNVDEFGMLIPFPSPPSIRKVDENVFSHVEAAIDPPAMVLDVLYPTLSSGLISSGIGGMLGTKGSGSSSLGDHENSGVLVEATLGYYEVEILREEAVGMYEVAVLQAGSPEALQRWMGTHGFGYPEGMEEAVLAYIEARWCFVAIKARVGAGEAALPFPGMRSADTTRPEGSTFDGFVQAMGFRFESEEPVLPMRLSVHNPTDAPPRNVVYMLTRQPVRLADLDPDLVVRQVQGQDLSAHLLDPLPLWWRSGNSWDVRPEVLDSFAAQRAPERFNGVARELIASDLLALESRDLELDFEEAQTELLNISEALGLRGELIDARHATVLADQRTEELQDALRRLPLMTLTVLDGHFDPEVLARQDLVFEDFVMPAQDNLFRLEPIKPAGPQAEVPAWRLRTPGPPPSSVVRAPLILGPIDPAVVNAVVRRHRARFNACYAAGLNSNPTLAGTVTIKFTIAEDGSVPSAAVKSSSLGAPQVEACLSARFLTMRFPAPEGGIALVSMPVVFSPG